MAVVLVVDDHAINREFLAVLLGYAGHEVHQAGDGREALEVAQRVDPDLVITDVLMPTMDGVEFTRRLNADPKLGSVPVMFYTATYRLTEARSLASSCGVTTVLAKPSDPQEVLDAVQGELGLSARALVAGEVSELTGRHRALAIDQLCTTSIDELSGLRSEIRTALDEDDTPSQKARQIQRLSTRLDASLTGAQALSMRLAALIELGLDLANQTFPDKMLEMFCHAGRDIMTARLAAVCTLDPAGGVLEFATWGMTKAQTDEVREQLDPTAGSLGELLGTGAAINRTGLDGRVSSVGLPDCHPPIDTWLAVPLRASSRTYGWFYVADRLGGAFTAEDEQLARTLVMQLVPEYENLILFARLKQHADLLESEIEERMRALAELRESETRFRQLAESIREVFVLMDTKTGETLYVSPAYEEIWDRSRESLYRAPESWLDAVHTDDAERVRRAIKHARETGELKLSYRIHRGGETRWIKALGFPIFDATGGLHRMASIAEDITEVELQRQRIERLSRIQAVLSGINSAIVRIRERGQLLDEACRIAVKHGKFAVAWIGLVEPRTARIEFVAYSGTSRAADGLSGALVDAAAAKTGIGTEALRAQTHVVHNDLRKPARRDRVFDLALQSGYHAAIALPLMPDRKAAGVLVLFAQEPDFFDAREVKLLDELAGDVSFALEYIARDERLHHLAYYDSLTDLPNTTLFHEHLARSLEQSEGLKTALFLADLDRFTHINDTLGRHVGDQLLVGFAERLRGTLSTHGSLARIGSDTFAIAVPGLREETEAGMILQERILAALNKPFDAGGGEIRVTARVGVAMHPNDGESPGDLFKNAEAALKEAKTTGQRYLFYSSDLNKRIVEDLAFEQELLVALEKREFALHYQPKVDSMSGRIVGLEALLRWNSPVHGLVAPGRFIPTLEASELILDVGQWVLEQAIADYNAWKAAGIEPPRIAVNVSPLQLRYADFPEMVLGALRRGGADGSMLELEITESVIMADIEASIERLAAISEHGVTIAVDDFGTGYSSLRYLARLPLHSLKVDRAFIVGMTHGSDDMTIVSTIVGLAHAFSLIVVAEGVDSEEQATFLRRMRCDEMQGYLFGKPQPAAEIAKLLEEGEEEEGDTHR